jgi:sugar lactone lactonase YvrE
VYEATHFLSTQNKLGEGAVWSPEEQALYWLDIENRCFHRLYLATHKQETFEVGDMIGVLALCASGGLVMATQHGFATWDFSTNRLTYLQDPLAGQANKRFNDGAIDCKGRFWAGSMSMQEPRQPVETLYRLDPDGSLHTMDNGFRLPNGMVWSPDNRLLYFTDSEAQTIYLYDFDAESGAITHRRPFITTPDEPGVPDGLTIDDEGFLWSMRWGGAKIIRYDPDGKVEREISLPVPHPTSCAFGGPDRREVFITTSWSGLSDEERRRYPQSGDLFHFSAEVTGTARRRFIIGADFWAGR